eukprot:TRINITY_DN27828_c0_g1_i1.p1 TRINITY_DN27828_c0_g1~~TRINITY_DN27828_c0_g1_i1.p1  ORF type:complete len:130 (-),score=28.16 TRINITY_DN27828_c0_g1_i1:15-404(-)
MCIRDRYMGPGGPTSFAGMFSEKKAQPSTVSALHSLIATPINHHKAHKIQAESCEERKHQKEPRSSLSHRCESGQDRESPFHKVCKKRKHRTLVMTSSDDEGKQSSGACLLYTSPSPRDGLLSRMPSSA